MRRTSSRAASCLSAGSWSKNEHGCSTARRAPTSAAERIDWSSRAKRRGCGSSGCPRRRSMYGRWTEMTSTPCLASARVTKVTSGFSRGSRWQRSADISMVVIPADAIWAIASSTRARAKSRDEIIRVTTPICGTRRAAVGYAHMTTAHLDAPRIQLPRRRLVIVTAGLLLSMALSALDTSIVATAMPRIIAELSGLQFYAWVTTAYLVTSTTVIPISGKLGDLFGRKRFVQGGMIGFLVASALCGLAGSMPQLVVARAIQGIFGGFLTSSVVSSMADLYTPAT